MFIPFRSARPLRALGVALTGLALAGCGGDLDSLPAVPASGTVTMNGKPLESGSVQFLPEKGRPATGTIVDGKFTMTTYEPQDGAIVGRHKVVLTSYKPVKVAGSNEPDMVLITPRVYADGANSPLTVDIPAGGKTDISFSLDVSGTGSSS